MFNADIEQFEQAIARKIQGTEAHVAATASIDELIDRGMKVVRELDVIMRNTLAGEPATLASWLTASHVKRLNSKKERPTAQSAPPAQ
jgi:hypothetical protein